MARKTTKVRAAQSTVLAVIKSKPISGTAEAALVPLIGSERAIARLPGSGGEVVRQKSVTRVRVRIGKASAPRVATPILRAVRECGRPAEVSLGSGPIDVSVAI